MKEEKEEKAASAPLLDVLVMLVVTLVAVPCRQVHQNLVRRRLEVSEVGIALRESLELVVVDDGDLPRVDFERHELAIESEAAQRTGNDFILFIEALRAEVSI